MKISTCLTFVVASAFALLSTSTTSAHPVSNVAPKPKPTPPSQKPSAIVFSANNWKGKSAKVKKYGCLDLASLGGSVSSVRYRGGPKADLKFFSGKKCKGTVVHQMDTSSIKAMGGPYKSLSVLVSKA